MILPNLHFLSPRYCALPPFGAVTLDIEEFFHAIGHLGLGAEDKSASRHAQRGTSQKLGIIGMKPILRSYHNYFFQPRKTSTSGVMIGVRGRGAADRSILCLSSRLSGVATGFSGGGLIETGPWG